MDVKKVFRGHLAHIVSQVLDKPDITPDKLEIITPEEKEQLLAPISEETEMPEYDTCHTQAFQFLQKSEQAAALFPQE